MIPLSSAVSGGLIWSKIPHTRGFELKSNGETVASLLRTSYWSSEVQAESHYGSWKFRRTGSLRTGTEIVDPSSNTRIATLKPNWGGGGVLAFSDGQTFRLISKGLWRPVWTVLADGGQAILRIRPRDKTVELPNELHVSEERLTLLVVFTWNIVQQASEDATAIAAISVATS